VLTGRVLAGCLAGALVLSAAGVGAAEADGPQCVKYDPWLQRCTVWASSPPTSKPGGGGKSHGGGGGSRYIVVNGVPCQPGGLIQPQPPKTAAVWKGHTDGAIYHCIPIDAWRQYLLMFWSGTAPAAPDPLVLARRAMAMMTMRAVGIGIVPEDKPGRVGIIGFPVWLWTTNPGVQTWGPQTRTVSAGPFSVTATARVDRVVWSMGDGHTVVCRTQGTPYEGRYGKSPSPDCGYLYSQPSGMKGYTITATSYWQVAWSGMGQSGVIPLQVSSSTRIVEGEVQVLVQ